MARTQINPRTAVTAASLSIAMTCAGAAWAGEAATALAARAQSLRQTDPEQAAMLFDRALPLLSDARAHLEALVPRCWLAVDDPSFLPRATAAIAEARRAGDADATTELLSCRGTIEERRNRTDAAFSDYDAAVAAGASAAPGVLAQALVLRGEIQHFRGQFAEAIGDFKRAYALAERDRDTSVESYVLNAMANLYADTRVAQYEQALAYYRTLLARHTAAGNAADAATSTFNIGATLDQKGDHDQARVHYQRALALEREQGNDEQVAEVSRAIGSLLAKQDPPEAALPWLDGALAYFAGHDQPGSVARTRLSRAIALRRSGRLDAATLDLDAARAHFAKSDNMRFLERIEHERAELLAAQARWPQAYAARGAQLALEQRLAKELREEHTSRLRVEFDTERKEQENTALTRENALHGRAIEDAARIRRLQSLVLALGALVIVLLGWSLQRSRRTARRMRDLALTDELTQLPNRRHLMQSARHMFEDGGRDNASPMGVLALDIDHFKQINDRFGHDIGDIVLRRVAAALRGNVRDCDRVGRTGGEEFIVLLPRTDPAYAAAAAERLRAAVAALVFGDAVPGLGPVTISIGATYRAGNDPGFEAIAKRADELLYRAKQGGRNRVEADFRVE